MLMTVLMMTLMTRDYRSSGRSHQRKAVPGNIAAAQIFCWPKAGSMSNLPPAPNCARMLEALKTNPGAATCAPPPPPPLPALPYAAAVGAVGWLLILL